MAGKRELNYAALRQKTDEERRLVETAAGRRRAELVLKNARYVNVFTHRDRLRQNRGHREIRRRKRTGRLREDRLPGIFGRAYPHRIVPLRAAGIRAGGRAARNDRDRHRSARDHQRHGHGRHRIYARGDRAPADRCVLYASELRPVDAARRGRGGAGLVCHRPLLRASARAWTGGNDELCRRLRRG